MRVCPKHTLAYDETKEGCGLCERDAALARVAPPANPAPPGPPRDDQAPEVPPAASVAANDTGASPEMPPAGARPTLTLGTTAKIESDGPQEGEAAKVHVDSEAEDTRILNELEDLRQTRLFPIVLIGFWAGGKTWFVNRLKHEFEDVKGYNVTPDPAEQGEEVKKTFNVEIHYVTRIVKEAVEGFAIIDIPGERLDVLLTHQYTAVKSVIAAMDMCGAVIVALPSDEVILSRRVHEAVKQKGSLDGLLAELAQKSGDPALIRAADDARQLSQRWIGADVAVRRLEVIGPELERLKKERDKAAAVLRPSQAKIDSLAKRIGALVAENEALSALQRLQRLDLAHADLTRFTRHLCFLSGLMSKLSEERVPVDANYPFASISRYEVDRHVRGGTYIRFGRPTFVALTKADLIQQPDSLIRTIIETKLDKELCETFDLDPLDTVRKYRKALPSALGQWFKYTKLDFVTAFDQHDGSLLIDYDLDHFGIEAVFRWIFWAEQWDSQTPSDLAALNRAMAIRASRDPPEDDEDIVFPRRRTP